MILSKYKETCHVLLDYKTIGGEDQKGYTKKAIMNILHENIDVNSRRLIAEIPVDEVKFISKLQSRCADMTFADKCGYDRMFKQVTHK